MHVTDNNRYKAAPLMIAEAMQCIGITWIDYSTPANLSTAGYYGVNSLELAGVQVHNDPSIFRPRHITVLVFYWGWLYRGLYTPRMINKHRAVLVGLRTEGLKTQSLVSASNDSIFTSQFPFVRLAIFISIKVLYSSQSQTISSSRRSFLFSINFR